MNKILVYLGIGHIIVLVTVPVTFVLGIINFYYFRNWILPRTIIPLIGVILVVIGILIIIFSVNQLIDGFNYGKLIKNGLYAYIRNPLYFGVIFFIMPGIVLTFGFLLLIPVPFLTYVLFKVLIKKEERYLEEKFGNEYVEYKKRVNSLIPKLKK
ncbi:MAG: methyltransferase family protein [bacterium]|jgi:protein-S-isoprenylcysteine O-methyltransferase Ste14